LLIKEHATVLLKNIIWLIKQKNVSMACGKYRGEERYSQGFGEEA
jgi:hypothetical protein